MLTVYASKAPAMGGRSTQMVLCTASNRQIAMGDSNRARRLDPFYNADIDRDRSFTSTPFATIHRQSSGVWIEEDRRTDRFFCRQFGKLRRGSRSLCLHTHWKSGTDGRLELTGCPVCATVWTPSAGGFEHKLVYRTNRALLGLR